MSSTELDKDLAATMTPEELEAINAEASPEEQIIMRQQAVADADGESEDSAEIDTEAVAEDLTKNAATQPGTSASVVTDTQAEEQKSQLADDVASDFKPTYQAQLPDDFNTRMAELTERESALWTKFDCGEIDRREMQAQLRSIESDRTALNTLHIKAEISSEMSEQTMAQEWAWNVNRFMAQAKNQEGIDYAADAGKQADLDLFVKALGGDPRHNDKPMEWFLQEAHRMVKIKNGIGESQAPKKDIKQAKEERKPPISSVPKTLAQVPGGDGPGDLAGEFANLDSLSGLELENALARLTPTQRERYSQGL